MIIPAKCMATDQGRDPGQVGRAGGGGTVWEGGTEEEQVVGKLEGRAKETPTVRPGGASQLLSLQKRCRRQTLPSVLAPDKSLLPLWGPVMILPVCTPLTAERGCPLTMQTNACVNKSWGREGPGQMGLCSASLHSVPQALETNKTQCLMRPPSHLSCEASVLRHRDEGKSSSEDPGRGL